MARENLIVICATLIVAQLVVVSSENIDWTTIQDDFRKLAGGLRKKCMGETGVPLDVLEEAEIGDFPDDEDGVKLSCYFKCVMEKGGVMKNGVINYKLLAKMVPQAFKAIGVDMLDECHDIKGKDKCELAYEFNKCLFNSNPVAYLVI